MSRFMKAMPGSIGVLRSSSCTLYPKNEISALVTRAILDTALSFDGLLVLLIGSIALTIFGNSLLTIVLGSTIITAVLATCRTHNAYHAFMALAPGGLPSSFAGFVEATRITRGGPVSFGDGFLPALAFRLGPTPYTIGLSSHQQLNQQSPEDVQQYFADRLSLFAALQSGDSKSESTSSDSTVSLAADACNCTSSPCLRTFVCPLADTRSPFVNLCHKPCLPGTLALINAPREHDEVCTIMRIIEAGAKYLASIDGRSR